MTAIKVGDRVTYRKPSSEGFMYMGLGGCVVKELHNVGCTEPTATIEWSAYHDGQKEVICAPMEWLTPES
jgi:hypothetical protein